MKVIILLSLLLIISSCGPVIYFEQPQPANTKLENVFPEALQGLYNDNANNVPLTINELTYEYGDSSSFFGISKSLLSDSLILVKHQTYYLLNGLSEKGWYVLAISIKNNDTLVVRFTDGEDLGEVEKLKKITSVKEIFDSNGNIDYYLINPTQKQFESMLRENMFSGEMIFTRVKK